MEVGQLKTDMRRMLIDLDKERERTGTRIVKICLILFLCIALVLLIFKPKLWETETNNTVEVHNNEDPFFQRIRD